jgi:pimeloyl-ACP methyl ester carboxylesterase
MTMQPIHEFGGSGQVVHLAVANGFPPQTYTPMLRPFFESYKVVSLPPRALWPGEQPPAQLRQWDAVADDLLTGLYAHDLYDVIAIGHSFGGIASMLAAITEPERFRALVLLDPTVIPQTWIEGFAAMQADGSIVDFPLVQGARRRRRSFESANTAYDYFKSRPLFGDWPDETVRLYADSGTRPAAGGQDVELAWSPEWEAYYFAAGYTGTWQVIPKLRGHLPILAIRGGTSDTFQPQAVEPMRAMLPEMAYAEVPGHGHLFPHSAPAETARIILDWLQTL